MNKRFLYSALVAAMSAVTFVALSLPTPAADLQKITVELANGDIVEVVREVTKGTPIEELLPKGAEETNKTPDNGAPPVKPGKGKGLEGEIGGRKDDRKDDPSKEPEAPVEATSELIEDVEEKRDQIREEHTEIDPAFREKDGSPSTGNPTRVVTGAPGKAFDELPSPANASAVPNFIIEKFRVPVFLLPIYQAAGTQYGIRWEILAAINEIETDYGRNLSVSSANAVGWMQFLPSTWRAYGVDANRDGKKDPYNPVDAIFAAANYLDAAGYSEDVRQAIFAYNHADWYVDSVMMRAKLIAGVPSDLTGSLTGLTEGRFPVYAKSSYADDLSEAEISKRIKAGESASNVQASDPTRREIEIFSKEGAPVIATSDGEIKEIGESRELGRFVVLQDAYGNQYTYSRLGEVSKYYPVPSNQAEPDEKVLNPLPARAPRPDAPASKGRQKDDVSQANDSVGGSTAEAPSETKERLFANPARPNAREAGGLEQLVEAGTDSPESFQQFTRFAEKGFGLKGRDMELEKLERGANVTAGTLLAKVDGDTREAASHIDFGIRPAGRGAPRIDPKPILDGWKLLEETAIYRANGDNVLRAGGSVGQVLLMSKELLEKRVLNDERIEMYDCGRQDVATGQIDRRVLATLSYLSVSGLRPTVTSLRCGRGTIYTKSGFVSNHVSGNAVDIARINGVPILGNQDKGGVTDQAVRKLIQLQGTMEPDEIISLLDYGGNSFAMGDHADHIHVGFTPQFGTNRKLGKQALAVLKPGQWDNLVDRLAEIDQPKLVEGPKKYVLEADRRASKAHRGE